MRPFLFPEQDELQASTAVGRKGMFRILSIFVLFLAVTSLCCGQSGRMERPRPATLKIVITIEGDAEKARHATIDLMDSMGSVSGPSAAAVPGSASGRNYTDDDGTATFKTLSGVHRVRISGPGIQAYEGEIEIAPNEMTHLERIRVRRAPVANQTDTTVFSPVPISRLNVPNSARKAFEKGTNALHKQHWEEGRKFFQSAISDYPSYDQAYNGLGVVEGQLQDTDAARKAFSKAIELNPRYAEAQRNMARLFIAQHEPASALPLLEASLETEPSDVWALSNASNLYLQAHEFDRALVLAEKVHSLPHQGMANAHMVAAYAADALGKKDVATKELHLYLEEDPKGPNASRARQLLDRLSAEVK